MKSHPVSVSSRLIQKYRSIRQQKNRQVPKRLQVSAKKPTPEDFTTQCVDDILELTETQFRTRTSDIRLEILNKQREYLIDLIARRRLVNNHNAILKLVKSRFFVHKRNFQQRPTVPWVKDMPLKPNLNNQFFFNWDTLRENKTLLFDIHANAFKSLLQDFEVLSPDTYTFKMARVLNKLCYSINTIDWGEFNALNFLLNIYKKQKYSFENMIDEITNDQVLPSPDPAVLHDNVLSVFTRINYFDYNDNSGEMQQSCENSLFVYRAELYPFLVAEYVILRFLLKHISKEVSDEIKCSLKDNFESGTYSCNVCQTYPGIFTLLYMLYYENQDNGDPQKILPVLVDIQSMSSSKDTSKVTNEMRYIAQFICKMVYNIENGKVGLKRTYTEYYLTNISFLRYNYFINRPIAQTNFRFLVR